ncbi:hypothetical protein BJY01DRAFT_213186 [Aspergillus pseudoustus]|uniref:Uncharacterized protein n=1 Tax=Aspergillus pseudoustus TaxID=1810923 RepID=A0ABR4K675_9EURO
MSLPAPCKAISCREGDGARRGGWADALTFSLGVYALGFLRPEQSAWAVDPFVGHLLGHHNRAVLLRQPHFAANTRLLSAAIVNLL